MWELVGVMVAGAIPVETRRLERFEVLKRLSPGSLMSDPILPEQFLESQGLVGYSDEEYLATFKLDVSELPFNDSDILRVYALEDSEGNISTLTLGYAPHRRWRYTYGCISVHRWNSSTSQIESVIFIFPLAQLQNQEKELLDSLRWNHYRIRIIPADQAFRKSIYENSTI